MIFTKAEWKKIEKMAGKKGKVFDNAEDAKKHLTRKRKGSESIHEEI